MTASVQFADIAFAHETGCADVVGRDEEVTDESMALERRGCRHRAHAAVVERERGGEQGVWGW
jgi:hypothetical protein